jgi:hypothetical protein
LFHQNAIRILKLEAAVATATKAAETFVKES